MENSPRPREICGGMTVPAPQMEGGRGRHEYCRYHNFSSSDEPHATSDRSLRGRTFERAGASRVQSQLGRRQTRFRRGSLGHVTLCKQKEPPCTTCTLQPHHPSEKSNIRRLIDSELNPSPHRITSESRWLRGFLFPRSLTICPGDGGAPPTPLGLVNRAAPKSSAVDLAMIRLRDRLVPLPSKHLDPGVCGMTGKLCLGWKDRLGYQRDQGHQPR